jgi:hypothetical protein
MNDKITIKVSRGETINLGNFESARLDISIEASCNEKDVEKKYEELANWCYNKLEEERKMYEKEEK